MDFSLFNNLGGYIFATWYPRWQDDIEGEGLGATTCICSMGSSSEPAIDVAGASEFPSEPPFEVAT